MKKLIAFLIALGLGYIYMWPTIQRIGREDREFTDALLKKMAEIPQRADEGNIAYVHRILLPNK